MGNSEFPIHPLYAFHSFYILLSNFPIFIYLPYWKILVYLISPHIQTFQIPNNTYVLILLCSFGVESQYLISIWFFTVFIIVLDSLFLEVLITAEHWKDVFRELSIRSASRITFLMVIWNQVLYLSTYGLFPVTMTGMNLRSRRMNFICPSIMQIFCIVRPFCNLSLSVPVQTFVINFVPSGDFLPRYLPLNHII